jgi:polyhydroxybutyrate depolymerase
MRIALLLALALAGCGRATAKEQAPAPSAASAALVTARPYVMHAPPKHDEKAPLLVVMHGFGSDHANVDGHLHASEVGDAHGFFVALPDGTANKRGSRFWNATDACCDFGNTGVDDVAYLDAILDDAIARYPIDPARVYLTGFSNGAFMSHRYACDRAERVAAIVAFAGDPWKDESRCAPKVPVAVLQVHGDDDPIVHYDGGRTSDSPALRNVDPNRAGAYPAARDAVAMWSKKDGCPAPPSTTEGARDAVLAWSGCAQGSEVQLWTRHGAPHVFDVTRDDMERVWAFLSAHHR